MIHTCHLVSFSEVNKTTHVKEVLKCLNAEHMLRTVVTVGINVYS